MPGIADETSTVPAPAAAAVQKLKTKEEALNACLEQHRALVDCFRTCTFMGWCCMEEHHAFWDCYKQERGKDQTTVTAAINKLLGVESKD